MSNLSRRSLVASAAALPAMVIPAAAIAATQPDDPIFAAIEDHRQADNAHQKAVGLYYGAESDFVDKFGALANP